MTLRLAVAALFVLAVFPSIACDETCAPGFYFDDGLATCIRIVPSA